MVLVTVEEGREKASGLSHPYKNLHSLNTIHLTALLNSM